MRCATLVQIPPPHLRSIGMTASAQNFSIVLPRAILKGFQWLAMASLFRSKSLLATLQNTKSFGEGLNTGGMVSSSSVRPTSLEWNSNSAFTPLNRNDVGFVYLSEPYPGRRHEAYIWKEEKISQKLDAGSWRSPTVHIREKALYDKAGRGAQLVLLQLNSGCDRAIHPIYKPIGRDFTQDERHENYVIESARARIENLFARLKNQFQVLATPYRGNRNDMLRIPSICCHLLNIELRYNPLRKDDDSSD